MGVGQMSFAKQVISGGGHLFVGQFAKGAAQIGGLIILSRILSPADIGVGAVIALVVGLGELVRDFGVTSSVMRAERLSMRDLWSFFWLALGIGSGIALILVLAGGIAAMTGGLAGLGLAISGCGLVILLNSIVGVHRVDLLRKFQGRVVGRADAIGAIAGLLAATGAGLLGAGYWSILAQLAVSAASSGILVFLGNPWIPRRCAMTQGVRSSLPFAWRVSAAQVTSYVGNSVDTMLLAAVSSAPQLGYYNRGFQLAMAPMAILQNAVSNSLIPALVRVRADPSRYRMAVERVQFYLGLLALPFLAWLGGAAAALVPLVLGAGWDQSITVVRFLAVASALQQMSAVSGWMMIVEGHGGRIWGYSSTALAVKVLAISVVAAQGAQAVALAYTVAVALLWPIAVAWAARGTPVVARRLVGQGIGLIALFGLAYAAAWGATTALNDHPLSLLVAASCSAVVFLPLLARRDVRPTVQHLAENLGLRMSRPTERG